MVKPTVIGKRVKSETAFGLPRPTVMSPGTVGAFHGQSQSTPTTAPPIQTIIPGIRRQGFKVTPIQLQTVFPGESSAQLDAVCHLLSHVIVETLTATDCAHWGLALQNRYNDILDQFVQISRSGTLQHGNRHMKRLLSLLQDISSATDSPAVSPGWFRPKSKTALELTQEYEAELSQLSLLLQQALPELNTLAGEWDTLTSALTPLQSALATHGLAAHFLAAQVATDPLREALMRQSVVLLQTQALIINSTALRHENGQNLRTLAHHIQHTVLTGLPSWIDKVHLSQRSGQSNATQRYALWQDLNQLLQPLLT